MSRIAELFRQVWANPSDDQTRLVLADALLSENDPRGELIQLQYHPERDHGRRAMRLLQRHGLTWLGALRGAVVPTAYERGFVASCVVFEPASVVGCEEWSTVHTIELDCAEVAFVMHPAMRSLRRIAAIEARLLWRMLDRAADLPRTLEELALALAWSELPRVWARLVSLPTIRVIELSEPDAVTVSRGSDDRLSTLSVVYQPELIALLTALPPDAFTDVTVHRVPVAERAALEAVLGLQSRLQLVSIREHVPEPPEPVDDEV